MQETLCVAVFDPSDPVTLERVVEAVREYQSLVIPCLSQSALLSAINRKYVDAVVAGFRDPFEESFELLSQVKAHSTSSEVVFLSEFDDRTRWFWVEAIQRGAFEFLPKPIDLVDLRQVLLRAAESCHPVRSKKRPAAKSIGAQALQGYLDKAAGGTG